MLFKKILRDFLPPVITQIAKRFLLSHKTYKTYHEALMHSSSSLGYEDPYLVKAIYEETKEYMLSLEEEKTVIGDQTLIHTLIPLCFIQQKETINIIDVGGACGIHYFPIKKMFGEKVRFNWIIVESGALVRACKDLENEELKFRNSLKEATLSLKNIDIVISSGAIQYFEDPKKILREIIEIGAEFILFSRLSLSLTNYERIIVQKSLLSHNAFEKLPKGFKDKIIKYPQTSIKESAFKSIIQTNYNIKLQFDDSTGIQQKVHDGCIGYGVLLEKNL